MIMGFLKYIKKCERKASRTSKIPRHHDEVIYEKKLVQNIYSLEYKFQEKKKVCPG